MACFIVFWFCFNSALNLVKIFKYFDNSIYNSKPTKNMSEYFLTTLEYKTLKKNLTFTLKK